MAAARTLSQRNVGRSRCTCWPLSAGCMHKVERVMRTVRTAVLAGRVYASYRVRRVIDRIGRSEPTKSHHSAIHERNARLIYRNAIKLRGLMIKLAQVIGTRSD